MKASILSVIKSWGRRTVTEPYLILLGITVAVVCFLVIVPLFSLLISSFSGARPGVIERLSLDGYARVYLDPRTYTLFKNTFLYAIWATIFGLACGTILAWLVERTNMPLKTLAYSTIPLIIVIPGALESIAWIFLLSPQIGFINKFLMSVWGLKEAPFNIFTIYGMAFVQGMSFAGTVFLMMVPAFRGLDPALEEAASMSGAGTLMTIRRITIRLMLPALLSAGLYIGIVAISVFEIPAMIGMPARISVFSTKLYLATHGFMRDYGMAGALSISILFVSFIGIYLNGRVTRQSEKFITVTGKGYRPRLINLGPWKYGALFFFLTYLTLVVILPFLTLVWVSLLPYGMPPSQEAFTMISLASYYHALAYGPVKLALKNTLVMMVTAATITMCLSSLVSWIVVRTRVPGRRMLDLLSFVPHGIPGIVIGLSLTWVYLKMDFIPIYGTVWIIAVAFITKYLAYGTRISNTAMLQLHPELEEAAKISGASWSANFTRIIMPLLAPAFINGWLFVAIHSMRDLSAPVMLHTGKSTVLAVVIWDLWNDGRLTYSAAVGVMLILMIAVVMMTARLFGYRIGRRVSSET